MIITKNLSNVTLKKSEENVSGQMGLAWIGHSMSHFGVEKMVQKHFPNGKSNRSISAWNKILSGSLTMIGGGQRVEDIEKLKADTALINNLGWKEMISPDTFLNFIKDKNNTKRILNVKDDISIVSMKKSKLKEFIYDSDATYFDSEKDCAKYSYQDRKQMSAMLGFLPELSGLCVTAEYRTGNESPATGILNDLKHVESLARKAGKRIKAFRHDSAAHNMEIFKYCNQKKINFYISIDKNQVIKETVTGLRKDLWKSLDAAKETEWVESTYCQMKNKNETVTIRILALRWPNPDPQLFDTSPYCYHVIGTNDWKIDPMDWLDFHNGRMNSENYNKEIKAGFSCKYTPSNDFIKNCNYFLIGILSYNMVQLMKLFYLGEEAEKWTIKTIRYWFVNSCGKFIKHARGSVCKIINVPNLTYKLFQIVLSKLVLTPV